MSTRDDGGPAFPTDDIRDANGNGIVQGGCGMSLRDWFAGQALAGYLAAPVNLPTKAHRNQLALACYHMADAMIAARAASLTGSAAIRAATEEGA